MSGPNPEALKATTPDRHPAPALEAAGGSPSDWRQDMNAPLQTAVLVTMLDVIKRMYCSLFKLAVGTNVVE